MFDFDRHFLNRWMNQSSIIVSFLIQWSINAKTYIFNLNKVIYMLFGLSFAKICVVMDKSKLISMAPMMEIF
jgi:Na+-transporting NADH:ubiquinone oxidoreductase subunit NqrD